MAVACPLIGVAQRGGTADVPQRDVTIVFTDIVGSTRILADLGEDGYLAALRRHNDVVRRAAAEHGGTLAKFLGDGWMVAFPEPAAALGFAVDCQRELASTRRTHPREAVRVRIGIHTGSPASDGDDLIGRDVVVASRLVEEAEGDEIVASAPVRQALPGSRFAGGRITDLPDLGPEVVYRVLHEEVEA